MKEETYPGIAEATRVNPVTEPQSDHVGAMGPSFSSVQPGIFRMRNLGPSFLSRVLVWARAGERGGSCTFPRAWRGWDTWVVAGRKSEPGKSIVRRVFPFAIVRRSCLSAFNAQRLRIRSLSGESEQSALGGLLGHIPL
jgi:hypothetical protein